ncbi:hypothetical protein CONPUDRAFT_164601 [Coniophora puteana RWD-64-598 SS2]|uniref:SH3 domain-containing protein n=1 Tax=Coniophora puteana (strain RWD-64-598) TaxID=741705 RepID=A0A5M3MRS9_CONPW|nr:uncharacterized protein CONPUDRAFT_164601 [Coniophora puteana RWD-64-598 SS2]EIW81859.1 hypothetical protein CONPUDRAFT_164601 [Coniophora puteana RWD-64-598 SS2]
MSMQVQEQARHPRRQDTFDLRGEIQTDDAVQMHAHADAAHYGGTSDEEHSVMEDDSDGDERDVDYIDDDDGSSSLSIPNESIDFDLVYSLHSFAATVEGQASVVKGDSLFLMDDSNSYWWLVRVLKTQDVGYIPAENIETPFERLARLNKHRNVDLAQPTSRELQDDVDRIRVNLNSHNGSHATTPSPTPGAPANTQPAPAPAPAPAAANISAEQRALHRRTVNFTPSMSVHRYPPAVWNEEEEEEEDIEWDDDAYEEEDTELAQEQLREQQAREAQRAQDAEIRRRGQPLSPENGGVNMMEPDDGMGWDDSATQEIQARNAAQRMAQGAGAGGPPEALRPAGGQSPQQQAQAQLQVQAQAQAQQQRMQQQQQQQAELMRRQQEQLQLQQQQAAANAQMAIQRDPAMADTLETKKLTVTPSIARDDGSGPLLPSAIMQKQEDDRKRTREEIEALEDAARKKARGGKSGAVSPSGTVSPSPGSAPGARQGAAAPGSGGGKLRKERSNDTTDDEGSGKEKKKKGGVFGIFGRNKNKNKDKASPSSSHTGSIDAGNTSGPEGIVGRNSIDSGRSSSTVQHGGVDGQQLMSPTTASAMAHQQQVIRASEENKMQTPMRPGPGQPGAQQGLQNPQTPPSQQAQVSQHASQLLQRDRALYQQYLNRSPSSPPEAPSLGLWSASAVLGANGSSATPTSGSGNATLSPGGFAPNVTSTPNGPSQAPGPGPGHGHTHSHTSSSSQSGLGLPFPGSGSIGSAGGGSMGRARPASLVLPSASTDGTGPGIADLSVIRVFAGKNVQTEATFKTVLLNASTSSADLVRQAVQRFRLPAGEDDARNYYLSVKQLPGGACAALRGDEAPLTLFERLVEEAKSAEELPTVRRSSVGSLSSVRSDLSMHPAIKNLQMNDFSDDSAVKFFLNKRGPAGDEEMDEEFGVLGTGMRMGGGDTTMEAVDAGSVSSLSYAGEAGEDLSFSSPSYRFAVQLVVYPEDLPEDMAFDPQTEAIVFKSMLRDRDRHHHSHHGSRNHHDHGSMSSTASGVSPHLRRKVFSFPKNAIVAEAIELGLERFGIVEGVVDGGDEVEDKMTKRRSSSKVRYWLTASFKGHAERELAPSSRIVDAYPHPGPHFKAVDRRADKRRSIDSAQLLGNIEDVGPDDPVFILRRAVSYRHAGSRHRSSAPLDDVALRHLRDSISGTDKEKEKEKEKEAAREAREREAAAKEGGAASPTKQMSRQELIAAQRAASREKQRAVLSTQQNDARGIDVVLPGNVVLRSSRLTGPGGAPGTMRYSYIQDGESFDISDIVEEELRGDRGARSPQNNGRSSASPHSRSGSSLGSGSGSPSGGDLLAGLTRQGSSGGANEQLLGRVLNKIRDKDGNLSSRLVPSRAPHSANSVSSDLSSQQSQYSVDDESFAARSDAGTPTPGRPGSASPNQNQYQGQRVASPVLSDRTARTPTPTMIDTRNVSPHIQAQNQSHPHKAPSPVPRGVLNSNARKPSFGSVMSEASVYATPTAGLSSPEPSSDDYHGPVLRSQSQLPSEQAHSPQPQLSQGAQAQAGRRVPAIPADDFGISHMMAIIHLNARRAAAASASNPDGFGVDRSASRMTVGRSEIVAADPVEEMLFGKTVDVQALHPDVRRIYASSFEQLAEMDKTLDEYLQQALRTY